jgi:hypothetical protein
MDLKPPVWLLVDEPGGACKIYFSEPDQRDLRTIQPAEWRSSTAGTPRLWRLTGSRACAPCHICALLRDFSRASFRV